MPLVESGWSVDELLIQDSLRADFLEEFRSESNAPLAPGQEKLAPGQEKALFERLIQIRKSGKLRVKSTKRNKSDSTKWTPVAEIASRQMMDRFQANVDQWLIDPELLAQFDASAQAIDSDSKPEDVRRAALRLRKSRRSQIPFRVLKGQQSGRDHAGVAYLCGGLTSK